MAKDPSVLFYSNDFLTGTSHMTREEKGLYIELLCHQQQKGPLPIDFIKRICGADFERLWFAIQEKFEVQDGKFFNKRMQEEVERRKKYTESRSKNRTSKPTEPIEKPKKKKISKTYEKDMLNISKTYVEHMENENEIEIENKIEIEKGGVGEKTIYQKCMNAYFAFIIKRMGVPPSIDALQGKSLNNIIGYLRKIKDNSTDDDVFKAWDYILRHWHNLDVYLGNKLKLNEIYSEITNIINQIKNPKQRPNNQKTPEQKRNEYAELDKLAEQFIASKNAK